MKALFVLSLIGIQSALIGLAGAGERVWYCVMKTERDLGDASGPIVRNDIDYGNSYIEVHSGQRFEARECREDRCDSLESFKMLDGYYIKPGTDERYVLNTRNKILTIFSKMYSTSGPCVNLNTTQLPAWRRKVFD